MLANAPGAGADEYGPCIFQVSYQLVVKEDDQGVMECLLCFSCFWCLIYSWH